MKNFLFLATLLSFLSQPAMSQTDLKGIYQYSSNVGRAYCSLSTDYPFLQIIEETKEIVLVFLAENPLENPASDVRTFSLPKDSRFRDLSIENVYLRHGVPRKYAYTMELDVQLSKNKYLSRLKWSNDADGIISVERLGDKGLVIEDTIATNGQNVEEFKRHYMENKAAIVKGGAIDICSFNKISNDTIELVKLEGHNNEMTYVYADAFKLVYLRKAH